SFLPAKAHEHDVGINWSALLRPDDPSIKAFIWFLGAIAFIAAVTIVFDWSRAKRAITTEPARRSARRVRELRGRQCEGSRALFESAEPVDPRCLTSRPPRNLPPCLSTFHSFRTFPMIASRRARNRRSAASRIRWWRIEV